MAGVPRRKQYFIDKKFQSFFIIKFCLVVLAASGLIGALVFFFAQGSTTVAIENTHVTVKRSSDFFLPYLLFTIPIIAAAAAAVVLAMSLFYTHKIAGPLFRLRREIEQLKGGDLNRRFILRAGDQMQDLAQSLNEMNDVLIAKSKELKQRWQALDLYLSQKYIDSEERQTVNQMKQEIEAILSFFKS